MLTNKYTVAALSFAASGVAAVIQGWPVFAACAFAGALAAALWRIFWDEGYAPEEQDPRSW